MINICLLNCKVLVSKSYSRLKSPYIQKLFDTNDILLFTETWLKSDNENQLQGFVNYRLDRTKLNK